MKTITFGNIKGGVGKSTLAVQYAFFLRDSGKRVLVIDLDIQQNASSTLSQYATPNFTASALFAPEPLALPAQDGITLVAADPKLADINDFLLINHLREHLARFADQFDYCVFDTPTGGGLRLVAALLSSQHTVAPIELATYSIDGVQLIMKTVFGVKSYNPTLQFLGLIPNRYRATDKQQTRRLEELRADEAAGSWTLPFTIKENAAIRDAIDSRAPVWENKNTTAREASKELRALFAYITEKMGGEINVQQA